MNDPCNRKNKARIKRSLAVFGVLTVILWQAGCAQVLVPGTLAGAGELYRYSTANVAQQTLVGNLDQVVSATETAFEKMNIEFKGMDRSESEALLFGETAELEIKVELQPVTPTATRVVVNAAKNHLVKDKATANEVLSQIKLSLERKDPPPKAHTRVFIKNGCEWPIRVAAYFKPGTKGPPAWQTGGWFSLEPGQKRHAIDTQNRFVYFYAESTSGENYSWAGDNYQGFGGRDYGFFEVDTGGRWVDFTQTFNCRP